MPFSGIFNGSRSSGCEPTQIEWYLKTITLRNGNVRLIAVDAHGNKVPNGKIGVFKKRTDGKMVFYRYDTVNSRLGFALDARGHVCSPTN